MAATDRGTPLEAVAEAIRESNEALAAEVLQRVLDQPPAFLEQLVLTLLSAPWDTAVGLARAPST
ncbi:hypothetical protein [Pseudonocardia asaccharolytica]|uniref:hypothetical protein n=1 Tax=Pseudonocardia asaccharolytica TaxID=54010 RepID=UPI0011BDD196|nr:hypothetical protein [Pseudonocardia asaccharolytica]